MIRVPIAMVGLATWLIVGLGARAWFGGKAYLLGLFGSERIADALFESALAHSLSMGELDMRPVPLLLTVCASVSVALVLLMWPVDAGLMRLRVGRVVRAAVAVGVATGATAMALLSVHPLLARRSVPEGPRTILNFACEAAGYDWINGLAYAGAVMTAIGFVWFVSPRAPSASASASANASEEEAVDGADEEPSPGDAADEPAEDAGTDKPDEELGDRPGSA